MQLALVCALALGVPHQGVPAQTGAPDDEAALALVEELERATSPVDMDWLRAHVRPAHLATAPPDDWYARLARALGPDGSAGALLRASEGPLTVQEGPDYTRVVLSSRPLLSVVVRSDDDHLSIDGLHVTSCGLCDEPTRFARDLIADVQRRGVESHRLLPGVELFVEDHIDTTGASPWLAALQARNHKGKELERILTGAQVVGTDEQAVTVAYADGTTDRWVIRYEESRWQLDYGALAPDSPLRLPWQDVRTWRSGDRVQAAALERWTPALTAVANGAGRVVGDRVIGARFHPLDGSVIAVVADLDRTLAGVVRLDPTTGEVLSRTPLPAPRRTRIAVGSWFDRWPIALSREADELLVHLPGRVWHVELSTGTRQLLSSAGDVTALSLARLEGETQNTVFIGRPGRLQVYRPTGLVYVDLEGEPVDIDVHQARVVVTLAEGKVESFDLDGGEHELRPICCEGGVVDAALRPDGSEVLATCSTSCDLAAQRVSRVGDAVREPAGAGSDRPGVSFSPDGQWFTTPGQGEQPASLLLWNAADDVPVARIGDGTAVHDVDWSPDSTTLLTVDASGSLVTWDLARARQQGGL